MKHQALIGMGFTAFGFSAYSLLTFEYNRIVADAAYEAASAANGPISFSFTNCFPDPHPLLLLTIAVFSGSVALSLLNDRIKGLSGALAMTTVAAFVWWFLNTRWLMQWDEDYYFKGFDRYLIHATMHDVAVLAIMVVITLSCSIDVIRTALKQRHWKEFP